MPKKPYEFKRDCHRMMDEIWGADKRGTAEAYLWLRRSFGKDIHFSDIHDLDVLQDIHSKMMSYKVIQENRRLVEEIAPAWDLWADNERGSGRRSRRFNKRRNRQISEDR